MVTGDGLVKLLKIAAGFIKDKLITIKTIKNGLKTTSFKSYIIERKLRNIRQVIRQVTKKRYRPVKC